MNYRQLITHIITDLHQTERNLNGLHDRGKEKEIQELENRLRELKMLNASVTDESYEAIKKYL